MTHYLLRLCTPNKEWGKPAVILAEVHKDLPRADYGWARTMHSPSRPYFTCSVCVLDDALCARYNFWLEHKGSHEDAIEAEKLRGEDVA